MNTITCPNCSAQVLEGAAFCDNCGASLTLAPDKRVCPNCQTHVDIDSLYCDHCGHRLPDIVPEMVEPQSVTFDQGKTEAVSDERPSPRLLVLPGDTLLVMEPGLDLYVIGRVDPASGSYPDIDLVPFGGEEGGVSRKHAQITRTNDRFFIEDLNSVNYTFVNKQKIALGVAHALEDGDEIRLGRILLRFEID